MTIETDLTEWPTTRPLTRWSWMVRLYWWLIFLFPPLTLLGAWDTGRTARSADEALGLPMFVAPFLLAALVGGPALAYRSWISPRITRAERILLVVMGLSAVLFVFLVAMICQDFSGWPRRQPHPTRPLTLALTALWLGLAIAARRKLHHGIPALWSQLWWILLLPAPPISFFLTVANLFPSKPTDDPSPYPLWPFLAGAVATLPLLAYRGLWSPTVTRIERILIVAAGLSVLTLFLFFMGVWRLLESTPSEATPQAWALFYALSAGWIGLGIATRLKLARREGPL